MTEQAFSQTRLHCPVIHRLAFRYREPPSTPLPGAFLYPGPHAAILVLEQNPTVEIHEAYQ
jgi:hypothetical protein